MLQTKGFRQVVIHPRFEDHINLLIKGIGSGGHYNRRWEPVLRHCLLNLS